MVRQSDPHGIITNKQLEWHKEEQGQYSATDRAYNGYGWECYLCHREFNSCNALNQHANSPVHQQKVYHCPNKRVMCGKQFEKSYFAPRTVESLVFKLASHDRRYRKWKRNEILF